MTIVGLKRAAKHTRVSTLAWEGQGRVGRDALAVLLVVVEDLGDRDDSGVLGALVRLAGLGLVPVCVERESRG